MMIVAIIDYNAGNTKSVINAINRLGCETILTSDPEVILSADKVILPGVGHAASCMKELLNRNLTEIIRQVKVPFLGVCVGMQLLTEYSEEGDTTCLNIVPGKIIKFNTSEVKVPKIGWNKVEINENRLFEDINDQDYFYFVHSYYLPENKYTIATSNYGVKYAVAIQYENFYGVQFHPEKSGKTGEKLIRNFLNL